MCHNRRQERILRGNWIFILVSCCLLCSQGCALVRPELQPPVIRSVSVQFESLSPEYAVFRCQLTVDNPNEVSLPIRHATVALRIAGLELANGQLTAQFCYCTDCIPVHIPFSFSRRHECTTRIRRFELHNRVDSCANAYVFVFMVAYFGRCQPSAKGRQLKSSTCIAWRRLLGEKRTPDKYFLWLVELR
jgi:hypothetical protein